MADLLARLQEPLATRYRIIRELGAGGMAVVFLAEDLRHRRKVALKVLRPELAAEIGPERFLREIETALVCLVSSHHGWTRAWHIAYHR